MKWFSMFVVLCFLAHSSLAKKKAVKSLNDGDTIPQVDFITRTRTDDGEFDWKTLTTDDYFKNKRIVLFALPGAFTPTCSSLPSSR